MKEKRKNKLKKNKEDGSYGKRVRDNGFVEHLS